MKVSIIDLSPTQKRLEVEIPASEVQVELDKRYRELARRVRLKGFRPGKVPRKILRSYYGKSIESEVSNKFIQDTYPEALKKTNIKPLMEASVDEVRFSENGTLLYSAVLEVCPPFKVENYKGIELKKPEVVISSEKIQAELEKFREQHAELLTVDEDQVVTEGHVVIIDLVPSVNDQVYDKGKATDYMLEVGKNVIHPEFDRHLIGHKAGEETSFTVEYPADAPIKDFAGKTVHFQVKIKEIKKKEIPELTDDFVRELGEFESVDALKERIIENLRKSEEERIKAELYEQIITKLIEQTEFDLPEKVIEREADRFVEGIRRQFQIQGMTVDDSVFDSREARDQYRAKAERDLRWRLIAERIAEQEGIELNDEEKEEIFKQASRILRIDVNDVKSSYADSILINDLITSRIQEKVLSFIADHAEYVLEEHKESEADSINESQE